MRSDSSSKQIKIGALLSYINNILGNLIPLFYTPIMLSLMGQTEYGLYKMASSATSYISLSTLGLGAAIGRFLIKERTQGDKAAEENVLGLFFVIFQGIALVALICGLLISANIGIVYGRSLNDAELQRVKTIITIMAINMAVGFSATPFSSTATAHERFIFIQAANILSTVALPLVNLLILHLGYRSIGLAVTSLSFSIVIRLAYFLYVTRKMSIVPRFHNMPTRLLKEIFAFSIWIFVSDIVGRIYSSTDVVIIGAIPEYGANSVAVYSVGYVFPTIMFSLAQVIPVLFYPTINRMVFSGKSDREISDMIIRIGRMQAFVVILICSGFIAFGRQFIDLYAGPNFKEAYLVAAIIMIPNCIPLVQSAAHSLIQAKNMHKFRSLVYILIALVNIVFTILLVRRYGIIGAAIPTGGAYLLGNGLIMNWYYWKKVHIDIPRFWRSLFPVFILGVVMSICTVNVSKWVDFYGLTHMLAGILVYTCIYGVLLWGFILSKDEKKTIIESIKKPR